GAGEDGGTPDDDHGEEDGGTDEPAHPASARVQRGSAGDRDRDQDGDLDRRYEQGDHEVPEQQERARDRRREQFALGAILTVDDHAQAGEDGRQGDEQSHGADRDERLVVDVGTEAPEGGLQRGRDHQGEQHRGQQGNQDLPGRAG